VMLNSIQEANHTQITTFSPDALVATAQRRDIFERNRHRVYAIAFWMTGNELVAEDLMAEAFRSAFTQAINPTVEDIDRALVSELDKTFEIPVFSLDCAPSNKVHNVRQ